MELNWGNVLNFNNEKEYYEVLGFLSKEEEYVRVYTESNDRAGAWAAQGRMSLQHNISIDSLPKPLMKAFSTSADGRISETRYVRNLKQNHYFLKEIDPTGKDFTKRLYKESLEKVLKTVPEKYKSDFYRGYHWNCEITKRARRTSNIDLNWDEETTHIETGAAEGRQITYYSTKYERSSQNRDAAIRIHGTKCMICGFDFKERYGELGENYIEVHHLKPLSSQNSEVIINPETDLICVCANCHRMLHRFKNYMVSVEELKQIVKDNK